MDWCCVDHLLYAGMGLLRCPYCNEYCINGLMIEPYVLRQTDVWQLGVLWK